VAVFLLTPPFRTELLGPAEIHLEDTPGAGVAVPTLVTLRFGPPTMTDPDGSTSTEPPERVLAVDRLVLFPEHCAPFTTVTDTLLEGEVRLLVNPSGRTNVMGVTRTTGNACGDEVLTIVADALRYHWLPNNRFAAPVDLTQPILMTEASP
jgi:hypothetical protein